MSTLPFDYTRCQGTTQPRCQNCRRTEKGREQWQAFFVTPPINILTGLCEYQIPVKKENADN